MLFALGSFAFMAAIADLVNPSWIVDNSILGGGVDWFWYGFFDLIVAIGAFYAGYAIWAGQAGGYFVGLLFSTLAVMRWFVLILAAPLWSVTMVVLWCLVVYGLVKTQDYPV
jgi:hypothetical protein